MNTTTDSVPHVSGDAGDYKLLHKYLHNRFADRVVLTFTQIEDILGFSLPVPAWVERDWWDAGSPPPGRLPAGARW